jgi:endonuclease/exonuclease/phosphatase family metal-dependent hydrolase
MADSHSHIHRRRGRHVLVLERALSQAASLLTLNFWNVNEPFLSRLTHLDNFLSDMRPAIVCLQEVPVVDGAPCLPQALREEPYQVHYLATGLYDGREEGLAICSRSESALLGAVPLPGHPEDRGRGVLAVRTVDAAGRPILVLTTHLSYRLDHTDVRHAQASAIMSLIQTTWERFGPMATLIAGDFNCTDTEPAVQSVLKGLSNGRFRDMQKEAGCQDLYTLDRRNPFIHDHPRADRRIDFVFSSSDWTLESLRVVLNGKDVHPVSDHYGLYFEGVVASSS